MNPMKLTLDNFGPIGHADLDLEGLDLAAVVGPNGAGKSTTFTIAPTWALFGTTKNGCSADNLIKLGSDTGSVCFEFEHRGERYKVIRTRSTNGKGKSSLELQRLAGDIWVPSSGATIRETEEKIVALLGLDSNTLVSSSMILQGRANEFTQKAPGERKYILSQILGLDDYEVLQAKAKEHVAGLSRNIEDIKTEISRCEDKTKERSYYAGQLEEINKAIKAATEDTARDEAALKQLRGEMAKLDNAQADINKFKVKVMDLKKKRDSAELSLASSGNIIGECEIKLEREPDILSVCAEIEKAEKTLANLDPLLKQQEALTNEKKTLISNSCRDEVALSRLTEETGKLSAFLNRTGEYREAEKRITEITAEIERLEIKQIEQFGIENEIAAKKSKISLMRYEYKAKRERLEAEIRELTRKTDLLKDAGCVDIAAAQNNPCRFLKDAAEASKRLPEVEKELQALSDADIRALEKEYAEMKEQNPEVRYGEQITSLKARKDTYRDLADKARLIDEKEKMLAAYKAQIREKNEAVEAGIKRDDEITKELGKMSFDLAQVPTLKSIVAESMEWHKAKEELPVLKERLKGALLQYEAVHKDIEALKAEVVNVETEISGLSGLLRDSEARRREAENIEAHVAACNNLIRIKTGEKAVCEQKLKEIEKAARDIEEMTLKLMPLSQDYEAYSLLVKAFGRDGIPALIIESAVPELEIIANEILGAMSNGRHSLEFRTQRELKSRSGMAETLDIIVQDWAGERPYETFSGGEQLRIDYAIRFALAELLTRKAGSRIEWLVIDEGLGSQDKEHRDLVLEAIRNVAGRFKKVFVITHVEEAQGAFQQQIRFESTQNGIEISTQH